MLLLFQYVVRLWRRRRPPGADAPVGGAAGDGLAATTTTTTTTTTSAAGRTPPDDRRRHAASSRGSIGLLAHQVRYELLLSARNPRARFFTFFFPVLLLVVFAGAFHGSTTVDGVSVKLSRYFMSGILAMSIVLACYGNLVVAIATLRETGVLKRRRATPVPPGTLIASQAVSAVVTVAIMGTILLVIAKLLYGIGITAPAIAATAATATVGALSFAAIGYAVSSLIGSPDDAQPIVQVTTMPLWFLSGVVISTQSLGGPLRAVGDIFPVEHLAAGLHLASIHTSFNGAISISDLIILAAWGVGAAAIAAWRFSWLPSNAAT